MSLFNRFDVTWAQAIDGPGGVQMGLMRKFYEEQRFWDWEKPTSRYPPGKKTAFRPLITFSDSPQSEA